MTTVLEGEAVPGYGVGRYLGLVVGLVIPPYEVLTEGLEVLV
jgi:hypothetical protein